MRWRGLLRRNSITLRQVRLLFLAAFAIGCLVFFAEAVLLLVLARDSLSDRQQQILSLAEKPATSALWEFNDRLAQETIAGVMRVADVRQVSIVHPDGLPFAAETRREQPAPAWKLWAARMIAGDRERVVRRLTVPLPNQEDAAETIGSLILVFDETSLAGGYVDILATSMAVTFLGAFLLVSVVAVLFDRFLTRPILSISRQVESVDAEDPQGRLLTVPKWHADTELGLAVQKINAMLIHFGNAQHALRRMATRDTSTNLPNRTLTIEHLVSLGRRGEQGKIAAVLAVLMDSLDEVKDLIGHEEADAMARGMAVHLLDLVGSEAFLGRIGVDSFAVVVENLDNAADAVEYAKRLLENLGRAEPDEISGVRPSVCIGIALYPIDATNATDLLRKAVAATAGARRKAQARWNFFEDSLAVSAHRRLQLESQLAQALEAGDFILYYQPQFSMEGRVVGAEALLRWRRDGEIVAPGTFIPVAEDSGLVVPLGYFVLNEACRALRLLHEMGMDITFAVNVSPRQLADPAFVPRVFEILSRHGIRPEKLEIEITEYTLALERGAVVERIHDLRARGIRIAIDDFGTGYSSLSYLRRFPVDVLKIDRSFIMDVPHDVAVPSTILTLAEKLGMGSVAEGIETEAQRDWLVANGCPVLQGYLFARPMPFDAFVAQYGPASGAAREGHIIN